MVHATAVEGPTGGRLRVGMIGRNAFIGAVHRIAMRLDDLIELKAGALSSGAENARASGADLGLAPDRTYSHYREVAVREAALPDGIEAAVIASPRTTFTIPSPWHFSRPASTSSATSRCRRRSLKRRSSLRETLRFTPYGEPSRILQRGGPGNTPLAADGSRMPGGHPEGYVEGFASGAAELISARRAGCAPPVSAKLDSKRAGRRAGRSVY